MSKLKIAIQKSGRLNKGSVKLLNDSGIEFSNGSGKLRAESGNFPIEILYLRDDDIPQYVETGIVDIGIIGENVLAEKGRDVELLEKLGFAKCRLSLAIPRDEQYHGLSYFQDQRIATSYPGILERYLKENQIDAEIEKISGSVEIAPSIGLAKAVCDIVSTGSTLLSNGLKEVATVMNIQAVLISTRNIPEDKILLLEQLLFRIRALKKAAKNKYILLNAPNEVIPKIAKIIPGMKSPTVLPLAKEGWSSLHSVIREDEFWEKIEALKKLGAEGILVAPIEKMII